MHKIDRIIISLLIINSFVFWGHYFYVHENIQNNREAIQKDAKATLILKRGIND